MGVGLVRQQIAVVRTRLDGAYVDEGIALLVPAGEPTV
jgi:hypothetical protein